MEYLTLYPIADVHWGAAECLEKEFQDYIKKIQNDPTAAVLLGGDLINNGIKSSVTDCFEEKYTPHQQKKDMIELLAPIKHKIVAGVTGNHEYRTTKESCVDIMDDIFCRLGLEIACSRRPPCKDITRTESNQKRYYMIYLGTFVAVVVNLLVVLRRQGAFTSVVLRCHIVTGHTQATKTSDRLIFGTRAIYVYEQHLIFVCTSLLHMWISCARPWQQRLPATFV